MCESSEVQGERTFTWDVQSTHIRLLNSNVIVQSKHRMALVFVMQVSLHKGFVGYYNEEFDPLLLVSINLCWLVGQVLYVDSFYISADSNLAVNVNASCTKPSFSRENFNGFRQNFSNFGKIHVWLLCSSVCVLFRDYVHGGFNSLSSVMLWAIKKMRAFQRISHFKTSAALSFLSLYPIKKDKWTFDTFKIIYLNAISAAD